MMICPWQHALWWNLIFRLLIIPAGEGWWSTSSRKRRPTESNPDLSVASASEPENICPNGKASTRLTITLNKKCPAINDSDVPFTTETKIPKLWKFKLCRHRLLIHALYSIDCILYLNFFNVYPIRVLILFSVSSRHLWGENFPGLKIPPGFQFLHDKKNVINMQKSKINCTNSTR